MKYKIIQGKYPDIERNVLIEIEQGWKPIGGVAVSGSWFYQAMVKE